MDIERLRRETATDHAAVEGSIPLMAEYLDLQTYIGCLQRMHGVVAAWEELASRNPLEWLRDLAVSRQRRSRLEEDLASFGILDLSRERPAMPAFRDTASFLGAMYVMEGSTLGGQHIARHVERVLQLVDSKGSSYFRGYGRHTGAMWKSFCDVLITRIPDDETGFAIAGAKTMFATFGEWMQRSKQENATPIEFGLQ